MTLEFVTPFMSRESTTPVYPVSTVVSALLPAKPWGSIWNPFFLSRLSLARVIPVLRSNSARFTFPKSKPSPNSLFISLRACAKIALKSLPLFMFVVFGALAYTSI